jgi:hypothetical protein
MGNGSTTEFTFDFPFYENSNIVVTVNGAAATGYTIIGTSGGLDADIPYIGGKVVFESAPSALDSITITRNLPLSRSVDYQPLAKIDPTTLNQDMNYMMEVLKDQATEFANLRSQYADIADKDSTTTLLARITEIGNKIAEVNQTISDFNTAITNGRIMSRDDFYAYTTNCIIKIPQDITLTLDDGTLKLKADSKCYLKTDTTTPSVTVASDLTTTQTTDGTYFVIYDGSTLTTVLTTAYTYATLPDTYSLPLGVVTVSSGAISSIDNVFNGFGYIGSQVFTLPGVKGLYPNYRNTDGTLKNGNVECTTVQISSVFNDTGEHCLLLQSNGKCQWYLTTQFYYNTDDNTIRTTGGVKLNVMAAGTFTTTSGVISDFAPQTVFRAKDYND